MLKLLIQIAALVAVYIATSSLSWHWAYVGTAMILTLVVVHVVWERFVFQPFDYLGVMPVPEDDPIMNRAFDEARETLSTFIEKIYPDHREDSMVKFCYSNASGETEHLWGDLVEVESDALKVYVRTPPLEPSEDFDLNVTISRDDVVDWSVEFTDGSLRGGFTNRALFKIFERQEGYMHPKFQQHMSRFKDIENGS